MQRRLGLRARRGLRPCVLLTSVAAASSQCSPTVAALHRSLATLVVPIARDGLAELRALVVSLQ